MAEITQALQNALQTLEKTDDPGTFKQVLSDLFARLEQEILANPGSAPRLPDPLNENEENKATTRLLETRLRLSEKAYRCGLDELMQATLDEAEALTGSCIGFFHFVDPDQENLTLQTWSTNTQANICKAEGKGLHYAISQAGVWVDCVRAKKPVIHNDYAALPHKKGMPEGHAPVRRELTVPVIDNGLVTAVLGVGNKASDYTQSDVDMVQTLASMAIDIVARKRAEDELRAKEELFRVLFQSHDAPFLLIEPVSGNIVDANTAAERFFGYSLAELRHMKISDINALRPEETSQARMEALMKQRNRFIFPHRLRTGEIRTVEVLSSAVEVQGRALLFSIINDITERRQAEEKIRQLNAELERHVAARTAQLKVASYELEAFSYSVSHDLRAPLRAINGFAQILAEEYAGALGKTGEQLVDKICANTNRMDQLINDLLRLSRISKIGMVETNVDMHALAHQALAEAAPPDILRTFQVQISELPPVFGDRSLLHLVWLNLFANAIKFSAPCAQRSIEAGASSGQGEITYYVKDRGVGFDPAYMHKLYGVFQRLHDVRQFEGNGVGLAIVQRIVQRHGGRVWAEGAVGQGATFYFVLPRPLESLKND